MIKKARTRSWSEWRDLLAQQAISGLSVPSFCTQHGVGLSAFYNARHKLKTNNGPRGFSRLVPITVAAAEKVANPGTALTIRDLDGRELQFNVLPEAQWLRRLFVRRAP